MDPLCHTLVGAALAETGLGKLSRYGTATLLVAANLPDVDVAAYVRGADFALAHRRGWTHGVLATALLPLALTAAVLAWDRWRRRKREGPAVRPRVLLGLAYLGLLTHPLLDWLNVYGVRLLMPFDGRWLYGDVLFIVDPWLWLVLGAAVFVARFGRRREAWLTRDGRRYVAIWGGTLALFYVAAMATTHAVAEGRVREALAAEGHPDLQRLMVAPTVADPRSWQVVAEIPGHYLTGGFRFGRGLTLELTLPSTIPSAVVVRALAAPSVRGLRLWARFPFYEVERRADGTRVYILDARYTRRRTPGFGGAAVDVESTDGGD